MTGHNKGISQIEINILVPLTRHQGAAVNQRIGPSLKGAICSKALIIGNRVAIADDVCDSCVGNTLGIGKTGQGGVPGHRPCTGSTKGSAAEVMKPVSDEPFLSVAVIDLMLSETSEPARRSPSAVYVTEPPFLPAVPHSLSREPL